MKPIRVLVADDHTIVRDGLVALLNGSGDCQVVGQAADGISTVDLAMKTQPDVVVVDISMPKLNGIEVVRRLTKELENTRILVLTMHAEEEYLVPLLEAGASGYLVKSAADRELVDAVRTVARGEMFVRPGTAYVLAKGLKKKDAHADDRSRYEKLTERERDVLKLIAAGHTAPEIGEKLAISPKTVDTYKQRINEKLSLTHRADYVKFALKLGLLGNETGEIKELK